MAKSIYNLKQGEEVTLLFRGSKSLGNSSYTEDANFVEINSEGEAEFLLSGETPFTAYRFKNRWCYGTSAERLSVV